MPAHNNPAAADRPGLFFTRKAPAKGSPPATNATSPENAQPTNQGGQESTPSAPPNAPIFSSSKILPPEASDADTRGTPDRKTQPRQTKETNTPPAAQPQTGQPSRRFNPIFRVSPQSAS